MPAPTTRRATTSQPKARQIQPSTDRRGLSGCRYRTIGPNSGTPAEWPLPFCPAACPIPRLRVVRMRDRRHRGAGSEDSSASGGSCSDSHNILTFRRLVAEVLAQRALRFVEGDPLARGVVGDLVLAEPSDGEIARRGMCEIDAADARGRSH